MLDQIHTSTKLSSDHNSIASDLRQQVLEVTNNHTNGWSYNEMLSSIAGSMPELGDVESLDFENSENRKRHKIHL